MENKPLIGVTPSRRAQTPRELYVPEGYQNAIRRVGGEMLIFDYYQTPLYALMDMVKKIDGMLLTGGPDIDPGQYGMEREPECRESIPERDAMEINLMPLLMAEEVPILGICRGSQLINIALGGTLVQDIPTFCGARHEQSSDAGPFAHDVGIYPETLLREIMQTETLRVNSHHHQCIGRLAPWLVLSAATRDGIIEGFESLDGPFIMGLQWHPELTIDADEYSIRPFEAFMSAARKRMVEKQEGGQNER